MGNNYISQTLVTEDVNGAAVQKETTQTLDAWGNVTQAHVFDYGNLTTPARTYNTTFLTDPNYTGYYINNRPLVATVTDASGNVVTLSDNRYDGNNSPQACVGGSQPTGPIYEWDSEYGRSSNPGDHGNVTNRFGPAGYTCYYYDETGNLINTSVNGHVATIAVDGTRNYAVPATITTNTTTTMTWSGFFGMKTNTGPNGDQAAVAYDAYGRVQTSTSPYGAITYYDYGGATSSPPYVRVGLDGRITKTTMDGFGRTVRVERFDSTGAEQSVVDTAYVTCGCSPLGKVGSVSQPYAVGTTPVYTTYSYDGLGRTVSAVAPDGASTTGYFYWSAVSEIVDPAGNWKHYVHDVFGNSRWCGSRTPRSPATTRRIIGLTILTMC